MIYEFIEMAENDVAAVAHRFKYLVNTDVKNFYPSIYTHSIPWAIHGKKLARKPANRNNFSYIGNRLDRLFQNSNDGCTNGVAIGPAVSHIAAEIVMSGVDRLLSKSLTDDVVVLRFKDDYRILAKSEGAGISAIKALQAALKEYRLELNDEKTEFHKLPNGIFREWVSQYHAANKSPKLYYNFRRFKETDLSVVNIDRANPGSGVIDRFLADIITKRYRLRVTRQEISAEDHESATHAGRLAHQGVPKDSRDNRGHPALALWQEALGGNCEHLDDYLMQLSQKESENRYLIAWICYFLRANDLERHITKKYKFQDPIVRATYTSRFRLFKVCKDFKVFQGVKLASKKMSLLQHLDVFKPQ